MKSSRQSHSKSSTSPKTEGTGRKNRKPGATWLGFAKPDDPIYKEGYSIHIGPLLGTVPLRDTEKKQTSSQEVSKKSK